MRGDGSDFDTYPLERLWLRRASRAAPTEEVPESTGDLIDHERPESKEHKRSWLTSSLALRLFSLSLHLFLVALHVALIIVWATGPEHHMLVSAERHWIVSLLVSAGSTMFTTVYLALLVFMTQTLSMRSDLQIYQTLSATHDNTAAWAGLGSAVLYLWRQRVVSASMTGVLLAAFYLTSIAILHVTMPNIFLLQSFDAPLVVSVATQNLPSYPPSYHYIGPRSYDSWQTFAYGSLRDSAPSILMNTSREGLHEGTLYDVVGPNRGTGNVTVNATGFNITCGTLPDAHRIPLEVQSRVDQDQTVALDSTEKIIAVIPSTAPNMISTINPRDLGNPYVYVFPTSLLMYTTIPIVDSKGNFGPLLNFTPPVQPFHCIRSLVPQTAVLDVQSRNLLAINPTILKTSSTWIPSTSLQPTTSGNEFIDAWRIWYMSFPKTEFKQNIGEYRQSLSAADLQKFNLATADELKRPSSVTLHDLENELSKIVAAMFWTLGHVLPTYGSVIEATADSLLLKATPEPPIILEGNTTVIEITNLTRFDLNIVAVAVGFAASTCLALISLRHSIFQKGLTSDENLMIDGTGILHTILLYRNHPQLNRILEQVHHPSNENLRKAGMVKTSFGGSFPKPTDMGSFHWMEDTVADATPPTETVSDTVARDRVAHQTRVPKRSILQSVQILRPISLLLHFVLIGMHLFLVFMWAQGTKYRVSFSLGYQGILSILVATISTTFTTIYSAMLVFITQTLSMRRDLQIHQPLTAVHDNAAAWQGLGSAFLCLWRQRVVPASISGVRLALFFLWNIALLQVAMPNIFLVQTLAVNRSVVVETQGLPSYPTSYRDALNSSDRWTAFAQGSLYSLPSILWDATTSGLHEGSLYDVPGPASTAIGNITVNATGFNMTCHSLPEAHVISTQWLYGARAPVLALDAAKEVTAVIPSTAPNIISTFNPSDTSLRHTSLFVYSTIPIIDSSGTSVLLSNLTPPVQPFSCTQSLVPQIAVIDATSGKVLEVQPTIYKQSSSWSPVPSFEAASNGTRGPNAFLDKWALWYSAMPKSDLPRRTLIAGQYADSVSVADLHFIQEFNLITADDSKRPSNITLHDFENVLSKVVAGMFWTLGHVLPFHGPIMHGADQVVLDAPENPPTLLKGNVTVNAMITEARIDMNILAILVGLATSIALAGLSMRYSLFHKIPQDGKVIAIDGTGILHTIWLYRNHSELPTVLEQIDLPTETNLRRAGMVGIKFGG
ncbi:hypothetical protein GGX14DRAFT_566802 [Mycena pura]|uniref:Uncharacterized protein n=1 Tax=Mycena pura TaxID=153505 RepID=A0AAD6YC78_9AGAR|nr:hypothetical protein GGX14DRAFT_566802 [Mycena pura]